MTTDHLGSPRVITDKNGNVISRRDFMPFGEEILRANSGNDAIRKRFTGYEKDTETDLDFAEARMYQNKHGRFTAVDPLMASASPGNPQTFNRYVYTGNNPINYTDPSGLDWCAAKDGTTTFTGQGVACVGDTTSVDNEKSTIAECNEVCARNSVTVGDKVKFLAEGKLEKILTPEQAQIAQETAVQVVYTTEEIISDNPELQLSESFNRRQTEIGDGIRDGATNLGIDAVNSAVSMPLGVPISAVIDLPQLERVEYTSPAGARFGTAVELIPDIVAGVVGGIASRAGRVVSSVVPETRVMTMIKAGPSELSYASRVRERAIQDPKSHNFPYSFDSSILSTNPTLKGDGYKIFQQAGTMNKYEGVFEIGVNKNFIIDHRFFRPTNKIP